MYNIEDIKNKMIQGNTLDVLKNIPDNSINMVITSPPYWGLRNYNTDPQIWDEDINCEHEWNSQVIRKLTKGDLPGKTSQIAIHRPNDTVNRPDIINTYCIKCGAWKGELGSEPSFKLYIKHLCDIFDEVKRILMQDGTCWINLGDSYAGSNQGAGTKNPTKKQLSVKGTNYMTTINHKSLLSKCDIRSKSLIGIPDRFKIAMIDNNWICRNEIIWHKPNAMPESVKDRFTDDFEKLFFFVKNKKYYFDSDGVREPLSDVTKQRDKYSRITQEGKTSAKTEYAVDHLHDSKSNQNGRNKRCVWSINTKPYKEAHFAVYPEELVKIPIKAGCPENGIVMDIFMGSGTTCVVAQNLGRNYIGIELKSEYIKIAEKRLENNYNKIVK